MCPRIDHINKVLGKVDKEGLKAVSPHAPLNLSNYLLGGSGDHARLVILIEAKGTQWPLPSLPWGSLPASGREDESAIHAFISAW